MNLMRVNNFSAPSAGLPPRQQAIRAKCFHPAGSFTAFPESELGHSIADRFERTVQRFPEQYRGEEHTAGADV